MLTPHNSAVPGDFAKTVLMPGDPLRAQYIAENFLDERRLVNNVRGIQGYTGTYKGVPVSVMASGMGMPTIGIYSYELFNFYGVENILRVGSVGALSEKLHVRDIILAQGACTNSAYAAQFGCRGSIAPIADYSLPRTSPRSALCAMPSATSSRPTRSTTTIRPRAPRGSKWAFSASRWNPPRSISTPCVPGKRRLPSAPFPTTSSPARRRPPRSVRPPSAR